MYHHTVSHIAAAISLSTTISVIIVASIIGLRRGEIARVRQNLLSLVGFGLLLAGNLMYDGPHGIAADILTMLGGILVVINYVRLLRWQKANKPAA